jgi:hypothetical protein
LRKGSRVARVLSSLLLLLSWLDGIDGLQLVAAPSVKCLVVAQEVEVSNGAVVAERMKCDGATDDTVEFQRAIDAARKSAKRLVLPSGTCIVTSTITIPDHIWRRHHYRSHHRWK